MHSDKLNQPLSVGDRVVYSQHGTGALSFGTVIGFSHQRVRVQEDCSWRDSKISKEPDRLLKVPNA